MLPYPSDSFPSSVSNPAPAQTHLKRSTRPKRRGIPSRLSFAPSASRLLLLPLPLFLHRHLAYDFGSSSVVTAAIALFTISSFTLSGAHFTISTSSFTLTIVPRIPPFVVTLSPGFSCESISCHCFCLRWF